MSEQRKTFLSKVANYWEYYKYHTLAAVIIVAVLAVALVQNAVKTKPDLRIAVFTYSPVGYEHIQQMQSYFAEIAQDVNGDGQVVVTVKNLSLDQNTTNLQTIEAAHQMLHAEMAGTNTLLYIVDADSEKYFENPAFAEAFSQSGPLSEAFYQGTAGPVLGRLPGGLSLYLRQVAGSALESEKGIAEMEAAALALMNLITQ